MTAVKSELRYYYKYGRYVYSSPQNYTVSEWKTGLYHFCFRKQKEALRRIISSPLLPTAAFCAFKKAAPGAGERDGGGGQQTLGNRMVCRMRDCKGRILCTKEAACKSTPPDLFPSSIYLPDTGQNEV